MILPREKNEAGEEEEDPRAELVQQLLEYKICKFMSYELKDMRLDAARSLFKPDTMPKELQGLKPPVDYGSLLKNTTLSKLSKIFKEILKRQEDKIDPIRSRFGKIEKEEVNMQEKEAEIREYACAHGSFSFRELIEGSKSRMEVIVSFLCILELIRFGEFLAEQDALFDDIRISVVKSNAA
ncbi:MAG: segregation/condensation protein A, partial [Lachnospiraceae bacterium]|nr:segregation/condensation protein A [Lachnospiraceae bacterium]